MFAIHSRTNIYICVCDVCTYMHACIRIRTYIHTCMHTYMYIHNYITRKIRMIHFSVGLNVDSHDSRVGRLSHR